MDFQWSPNGVTLNFRGRPFVIASSDKIVMGGNILRPLGITGESSGAPVFRRLVSAFSTPSGTIITKTDDPKLICSILKWEPVPGETQTPQLVYLWASEAAALLATQQKTAAATTAA